MEKINLRFRSEVYAVSGIKGIFKSWDSLRFASKNMDVVSESEWLSGNAWWKSVPKINFYGICMGQTNKFRCPKNLYRLKIIHCKW